MKINTTQIDKLKINSIFVKNEKISNNIKIFSEINEKILNENDTLNFVIEIELISFGSQTFENKDSSTQQNSLEYNSEKRSFNKNGDIVILKNGKKIIKNKN